MGFNYIENTTIKIDGIEHQIRFEKGMTGIGSRAYWIDDVKQSNNSVRQSKDITNGNHFIYTIKWRDTPWDRVDIIISEEEFPIIMSEENEWREPLKKYFNK